MVSATTKPTLPAPYPKLLRKQLTHHITYPQAAPDSQLATESLPKDQHRDVATKQVPCLWLETKFQDMLVYLKILLSW